jgi:transcriptional regulator with XRE-family HTH domain
MLGQVETNVGDRNNGSPSAASGREVISCKACGLVQYRTHTENCRRCLHVLLLKVEALILPAKSPKLPEGARQLFEQWPNLRSVENVGQRIQQLRKSRGLTQIALQAFSGVSRSYVARIEIGRMTPSLGTLEKISEALGIGINRFFLAQSNSATVLDDPFILELLPFTRRLDHDQRQFIAKCIAAIGTHESTSDRQPCGQVHASRNRSRNARSHSDDRSESTMAIPPV